VRPPDSLGRVSKLGWGNVKDRPASGDEGIGCLWSPTGEHMFQLVQLDGGGRQGNVLADRCSYCGNLAFPLPGRQREPEDGWGRPAVGRHN
jgi:hypothetical protein